MRYPIAIERGDAETAWGVVVPDLPGCFSAGDTLDEAIANGEQAVSAWLEAALVDGKAVPQPSSVQEIALRPEFAGWTLAVVQVAPDRLDAGVEAVNQPSPHLRGQDRHRQRAAALVGSLAGDDGAALASAADAARATVAPRDWE